MADTNYVDGVTLLTADTMNDVNRLHYTIFGDPATVAAAAGNLISGLTDDTTPDLAADYVATYDASGTTGKKVLTGRLGAGVLTAEQATTSGTSIDFTSIPSWAKKITVMLIGVSTNGSSNVMVQIGASGGIETTGYLGASGATSFTTGFGNDAAVSTAVRHGAIVLTLQKASTNTWIAQGVIGRSDTATAIATGGSKSLAGALDRLRLTTVNGTDAFDAGAVSIHYE